jgi:hypothetical protein
MAARSKGARKAARKKTSRKRTARKKTSARKKPPRRPSREEVPPSVVIGEGETEGLKQPPRDDPATMRNRPHGDGGFDEGDDHRRGR